MRRRRARSDNLVQVLAAATAALAAAGAIARQPPQDPDVPAAVERFLRDHGGLYRGVDGDYYPIAANADRLPVVRARGSLDVPAGPGPRERLDRVIRRWIRGDGPVIELEVDLGDGKYQSE